MVKLDIGSGDRPLPPEDGWLHLDINPESPHVEYVASATKIPLQDNSVDWVNMAHVIEHIGSLPEVVKALKEVYRILKPTGKLEIRTPNFEVALERGKTDPEGAISLLYGRAWLQPYPPYEVHRLCFTKELLERVLTEAGFNTFCVYREPADELYAIAFKKSPQPPPQLKLAFSFPHDDAPSSLQAHIAEAYLKAASQLSIDAVSFTYDSNPPKDVEERIEIFRCSPWDARRRSPAYAFIPWIETYGSILKWPETLSSEARLSTVDLVFTDTPSNASLILRLTDTPTLTFPPGYDPDLFYYIERDFEEEPFTFMFVGAPDDRLGAWEVIQAFQLAFSEERDVQLLIVAGDKGGEWEPVLQDNPKIVVDATPHPHEEMIEVYAKAHCLVRPALHDPVSLTVLEALATGLPIIAPRNLFYRELLPPSAVFYVSLSPTTLNPSDRGYHPYMGGWIVPDLTSLAKMMRMAYEDRAFTKRKGESAAHFLSENLTAVESLKRILPLLERLVGEGKEVIEELQLRPHLLYSFTPKDLEG